MSLKKYLLISAALCLIPSFSAFAGTLEDGINLYKAKDYNKAIDVLKKAVSEDPESPEPHYWLAKSYEAILDLDKVFPETKVYEDLKSKRAAKEKQNAAKKAAEEQKKLDEANAVVEVSDPNKIVRVNDDYLIQTIRKRTPDSEVKNLRFLEFKDFKALIDLVPTDTEALNKFYRQYQIKTSYGIASPGEMLLFNKAKTDLMAFDIDSKKLELAEETDTDRKKVKQAELDRYIKEYNLYLSQAETIINQPVYSNISPISYEYYLASETTPEAFIQNLEEKKANFKNLVETMSTDLKAIKKTVEAQEKDLLAKKKGIDPNILDADVRSLSGDNREKVSLYQGFRDKLEGDKTKVRNLSLESEVLVDAYNKMNQTIKKIKPDYVVKDLVLSK
ncbi:tetratricopeptide repeat protein [bacterium]|nr:MAG: tetratricopeptide repeat protein [bacterium]